MAKEDDLPLIPEKGKEQLKRWLKPALDPYEKGEYESALQETKKLLETASKETEREVALFLKGDIYLKLAGDGDTDFLQMAIDSFREANIAFPESVNSARGLWKIGAISSRLGLQYESIASYKRILLKFPDSPYASKALLGIAHTYQVWERWKEALDAYSKISPSSLAPEDRPLAVLGLAETLYYSNDFAHAYMIYSTGLKSYETYLSQQPLTLYHFGDSAYQTGRRKEAKEIFLKFYNIFPRDPLTLMVLSRLVNIFYLEEDGKASTNMVDIIQSLYPGPLGTKITDLINEIEEIKTQECLKKSRKHGLESFIIQKCTEGDPKQVKVPRDGAKVIGDMIDSLLQEPPPSITVQQFVFQEGEQFLRLGKPLMTFEINKKLYPYLEGSPLQRDVLIALNKSAVEAVDKEYQAGNDLGVVEIYFGSADIFSGKLIFGPTGFKIASSLIRNGFYSQALPILETSMNSTTLPQMDEALYLYANTLTETGEYVTARKKLEFFLKKYPESRRKPDVIEALGNILLKAKKYDLAIEKFKLWLSLYAAAPNARNMSLKLASTYDKNQQFRESIPIYQQLLQKEPHLKPVLYQKLGDNYFQLK
ncbi:MAG: tetratricopeptide repeat protein, partial [Nitrospirae bacterium]|nr:tetratricopeptide repeat protein [Nitrospirota bacterium]